MCIRDRISLELDLYGACIRVHPYHLRSGIFRTCPERILIELEPEINSVSYTHLVKWMKSFRNEAELIKYLEEN